MSEREKERKTTIISDTVKSFYAVRLAVFIDSPTERKNLIDKNIPAASIISFNCNGVDFKLRFSNANG